MKTKQTLREFLANRIAANLSQATISWYEDRLLPFAKGCPTLPRRPEPIERFLAEVQGSPETRYDVYRALKTFFKFMSSRRRLPNPMDAIQSPRRPKTLMPTLEVGETMMLLYLAQSPRDRAIITLLVDCGVRAGEVCSLLKHNIKQETIIVHGKTGWREVPISEETRRLLIQVASTSLSSYQEVEYVIELLGAGAAGYLLKSARDDQLSQAIRSVRVQEFVCHLDLARKLMKHVRRPLPMTTAEHLTMRELEVLELAAKGMSTRDIAAQLGIGPRTVKHHLMSIFSKMGISSRTEAVLKAIRHSWVSLEHD